MVLLHSITLLSIKEKKLLLEMKKRRRKRLEGFQEMESKVGKGKSMPVVVVESILELEEGESVALVVAEVD